MKNLFSSQFQKMRIAVGPHFASLLFVLFIASMTNAKGVKITPLVRSEYERYLVLPDTVPDTSETAEYSFGDTVEVYTSGLDTISVLFEDSTERMFILDAGAIYMNPYSEEKTVNEGLYGINVSSMFDHVPEENNGIYIETDDPWTLISNLKPKVLRFPDGAGGKFSRLLGSENLDSDDAEDFGTWNGGYGFNLTEMIPYYDATYNGIEVSYTAEDIFTLNLADKDDPDWDWIDDDYVADFISIALKYQSQVKYDPGAYTDYAGQEDEPLFINQFIRLVKN